MCNKTLTEEYAGAWASMGLSQGWQMTRIKEWANMLEKRVAELDPDYRAYPFGRIDNNKPLPPYFSPGTFLLPHVV